ALRHILAWMKRGRRGRGYGARVVYAVGHAEHLESRPVVQLEWPGREPGRGMIAEIRREIGDPDLVSNARLMRPREPWHGRYATAHEPPRVTQQIRRSDGIGEQRERLDHRPFVLKRAFELGLELFGLAPIAEHETIEGERAQCVRVARVDRQHPFPRAHRLLVPCEIGERVTAKVEGFGIVGLERKRAVEGRE